MTDIPRNTALIVLTKLSKGHSHHLDRIITDDIDHQDLRMTRRDRNLINALIYGVLRWRQNLDWIIRHYSKIKLEKIRPDVLNILRLGLFQIFFSDRIPDSAAVNTSVEMAKEIAPPWVVKYVNAVLRNTIRSRATLPWPSVNDDPETALAILKSFPQWLISKWVSRFGVEKTEQLCDAVNKIPPITIRTNTIKTSRNELFSALAPETGKISKTPYSPDGICFFGSQKPVHEFSVFKKGWFQVQDEAAQLISHILSPRPNEKILDACAGLGGKTGHIAQLMKNKGQIIAIDKNKEKLLRLYSEMIRLDIQNVETVVHDLEKPLPDSYTEKFDKILLDAPCSGLGVIRRNPDIKWDVSRKDLNRFKQKQIKYLNLVSQLVKPKGLIVYAVCSIEPEENEAVIKKFLKNNSCFKIYRNFKDTPINIQPFLDQNGFIRTLPHIHGMDGFFSVCLQRTI
ncbi:MAG: 16S rRNA (cytosine(967)-C(5))-methyltransferase RsmB [Dissulfuribacterales bacterium]